MFESRTSGRIYKIISIAKEKRKRFSLWMMDRSLTANSLIETLAIIKKTLINSFAAILRYLCDLKTTWLFHQLTEVLTTVSKAQIKISHTMTATNMGIRIRTEVLKFRETSTTVSIKRTSSISNKRRA